MPLRFGPFFRLHCQQASAKLSGVVWASIVELRRLLEGLPVLGLPVGQKIADIDVGFQFCFFGLRQCSLVSLVVQQLNPCRGIVRKSMT